MNPWRARQRLEVVVRRLALLLARGYTTLLSAAVISGVLVLALTSDAFELQDRGVERAAAVTRPLPSLLVPPLPAAIVSGLPPMVLYIVSSELQRNLVAEAMRSDAQARYFGGAADETRVLFFQATDAREDAEVARLIERESDAAAAGGLSFRIVDLRNPLASP
jgi:hypothetical protein